MHEGAYLYVERVVAGRSWRRVVEVGSRNINGGVRDLIDHQSYTGLDLHPGPGVDIVTDCRSWAPTEPADLVVCCEVLEHADDPAGIVKTAISYLAKRGRLVVTCAGPGRQPHSGFDGGPLRPGEHYANVDPDLLGGWLDELADVQVEHHPAIGDVYATGVRR